MIFLSVAITGLFQETRGEAAVINADGSFYSGPISVNVQDSLALVDLFHATNGNDWEMMVDHRWLEAPVKYWTGIRRIENVRTLEDPDWRVTRINLRGYNLNAPGYLPTTIGDLSYLEYFEMTRFLLSGPIPKEVENLEHLYRFDVNANQLTEGIPWEEFARTPVEQLFLQNNELTGEIPPVVANFEQLSRLYVNNNELTGEIPLEFSQISTLTRIRLYGNNFTGSFPDLSGMTNLTQLRISGDFDPGPIPGWLQGLQELEILDIQESNRTGEIPDWFDKLPELRRLYLGDEELTGSLPDLQNHHALEILSIINANLNDDITQWITELPVHMWHLELRDIPLTGTIPQEIGNIQLNRLILHNLELDGELPLSIENNIHLNDLDLGKNNFEGLIPGGIAHFNALEVLNLQDNPLLVGSVPLNFTNLIAMKNFKFDGTGICLPDDDSLDEWLEGIEILETSGIDCPVKQVSPAHQEENVPVTPEMAWATADIAKTTDTSGRDFQLQLADDMAFENIIFDVKDIDSLAYHFSDSLEYRTTYYWRVLENENNVMSGWSGVWAFSTESRQIPDVPVSGMENEQEDVDTKPLLVWEASERAEFYDLQLALDSGFSERILDERVISQNEFQIAEALEEGVTYYWRIRAGNQSGYSDWSETLSFTTKQSTSADLDGLPVAFELDQNYPNPFNPVTTIAFELPVSGEVRLEIYDVTGRKVAVPVDEQKPAGRHEVVFDASQFASGPYFYRLQAEDFVQTRIMMLVK